jgi:hypothetical protein
MNAMKYVFQFLVAIAFLSEAQAQDVKRNIPYADPAHERQVLDVHAPPKAKNLPVSGFMAAAGKRATRRASR